MATARCGCNFKVVSSAAPLPVERSGWGTFVAIVKAIPGDVWWLVEQVGLLLWCVIEFMFFILGARLIAKDDKADNYEGWGYVAWAVAAWAFAIPEVYGAAAGHNGHVQTLSTTVGNLLNHHDYLSPIVVGLLVFAVIHVVRIQIPAALTTSPTDSSDQGNPKPDEFEVPAGMSGRVTQKPDSEVLPVAMLYDAIALVAVGLAFLIPVLLTPNRQIVGEWGYGVLALALFFVPGMLAYRHGQLVPFPSLFRTILNLEKHSRALAIVFSAGFVFLMIHLVFYPFPSIIPDIQGLHHHCSPSSGPKPAICINP